MTTSSITSKGQVTIPSALREKLRLQPGDKVVFEEKDGVITIIPANDDIETLAGCLSEDTQIKASLDDMEQAIKKGARHSWNNAGKDSTGKNNAGH